MPAKYKPTEKRVDRATKRVSIINYYIHTLSNDQMIEELNKAKPVTTFGSFGSNLPTPCFSGLFKTSSNRSTTLRE